MKSRFKILILVSLLLYGILVSFYGTYTNNDDYPATMIVFYLNPISLMIFLFLSFPLQKLVSSSNSIVYPIFMIISNAIFWIPIGVILIKYFEKREKRIGKENEN